MIDPKTKLSEHFTLGELCKSDRHPEIYNVPPFEAVDNLTYVCLWLEKLRAAYISRYNGGKDRALLVNSGYRSKMLNKAVGGVPTSNHLKGTAVDIRCDGRDATERGIMALRYATLLVEILQEEHQGWEEIIIERCGTAWWVHFAISKDSRRRWLTVINKTK